MVLHPAHRSPDGDPLDALVIARSPFVPGCVVRARPIGVLNLEDEHGGDEKLICACGSASYYADVGERQDLPSIVLQQIEHFFTHYKDLESEKWVRVGHWGNAEDAKRVLLEAIDRAQSHAKVEFRQLRRHFATILLQARLPREGGPSMQDHDRIYFAQRAAEEQALAQSASNPDVAKAHLKMQRAYLEKASVGGRPAAAQPTD